MAPKTHRLINVQILRGVAALLVVLTHAIDASLQTSGEWAITRFGYFENFGAFGVDLFFVISGFVMAVSMFGKNGWAEAVHFLGAAGFESRRRTTSRRPHSCASSSSMARA